MGVLAIRTVILYVIIVFALRIMGKRQLGELQPSELVVTILVSNIATLSIEDTNIPLMGSVLPIFVLVICEVMASLLILKCSGLRKIISGNPCIIIRDGEIDQKVMRELRWSIDDLMEQLRIGNIFDIGEVSCAIVETSGALSIFKKFEAREATAGMLKLPIENECDSPPVVVISDGKFVEDSLNFCNINREWVAAKLAQKGLLPKDVFLMTCNRRAQYYISARDKNGKKGAAKA